MGSGTRLPRGGPYAGTRAGKDTMEKEIFKWKQ